MSGFGLSCVSLAGLRGDSGAGALPPRAWTWESVVLAHGSGFGHWSALLVGSCEAVGCCERIEGVGGV